jgi:hypothetical protein
MRYILKYFFTLFAIFLITELLQAQTGIGTTTPAVKLHVKSNGSTFRLEGTDHVFMELYPQGSATRYAYFGFPGAASTSLTMMNNNASGSVVLGTNSSSRLTIDNVGNTTLTGNLNGNNSASSTISNFGSVLNDQSGTSYTLLSSDNGKIITINNSGPITLNVPYFSIGFNCMVIQKGTGQVTLSISGTTTNIYNRYGFTKTAGQYAILTLVCQEQNKYISSGDMSN